MARVRYVNFDFSINTKKLREVAQEKLIEIIGRHRISDNIHGFQSYPSLEMAIFVVNQLIIVGYFLQIHY